MLTDDLGLVPGNRVLLRGPNNPWLAACWLGVLKAGGVAVATMPMLRAAELTSICDIAQIKLALCDHRFTADLRAAAIPDLRVVEFGGTEPVDLTKLCRGEAGRIRLGPDRGRRRGNDRLHIRHDR